MSCIHTGAYVHFENYGFRAVCDVFSVADCYIFRWNDQSNEWALPEDKDWKVGLITNSEQWIHRPDLCISIVPKNLVTPGSR